MKGMAVFAGIVPLCCTYKGRKAGTLNTITIHTMIVMAKEYMHTHIGKFLDNMHTK